MDRRRLTTFLVALSLLGATAGCGGDSDNSDPVATGATTPTTARETGASEKTGTTTTQAATGESGTALPSGLATGTLDATVSGAVSKTIHLGEVTGTFGTTGASGVGPGYTFYASEQDALKLRLPAGPVGTTLRSSSLEQPLQVDLELADGDLFGRGDCTVELTKVTTSTLEGSLDCRGMKGSSTGGIVDLKGTFVLSS